MWGQVDVDKYFGDIRLIREDELEELAHMMARRFSEDPGVAAQLVGIPGAVLGQPIAGLALELLYEQCLSQLRGFAAQGLVHMLPAGERQAIAGFFWGYGSRQLSFWRKYAILVDSSRVFKKQLDRKSWRVLKQNTVSMAKSSPSPLWMQPYVSGEYYYLQVIVVERAYQGTGAFRRLLSPVLSACDQQGMAVILETQNEDNIPLYEHFGFTVAQSKVNEAGGFTHACMVRQPQKR